MEEKNTIYVGCDHAGFEAREVLREYVASLGFSVVDLGNTILDPQDDYPDFAYAVGSAVADEQGSKGLLFCGSSEGMCIAANKISGIRAVSVCSPEEAQETRWDNDSNVLCLGARFLSLDQMKVLVKTWLEEPFPQAPRHIRRIEKISSIERQGCLRHVQDALYRKQVIPAILTDSKAELEKYVQLFAKTASWIQLDIMDDTFVPGKTVTLTDINVRHWGTMAEAHLMVSNPMKYVDQCRRTGFHRVIFHHEVAEDTQTIIDYVHSMDMEVGIAINPGTSIKEVVAYGSKADVFLAMGVQPGKSGQKFLPETIKKIETLRRNIPRSIRIGVDGGVSEDNISELLEAGGDLFSVGSALTSQRDPLKAYGRMKELMGRSSGN